MLIFLKNVHCFSLVFVADGSILLIQFSILVLFFNFSLVFVADGSILLVQFSIFQSLFFCSADPELAAQGPQNRHKITATLGLVVHAAGKICFSFSV
jgi:hypothetical protein